MADEVEELRRMLEQRSREIEALNLRSMKLLNERAQMIEELQEGNRGLSALIAVAQAASQSLEPQQVLSLALDRAMEALDVKYGWIQLLREDRHRLTLTAQRGFAPELVAEISTMEAEQSPMAQLITSGETEMVEDISADSRDSLDIFRKAGLQSFAAAPLKSKERIAGVIGIAAHTRRHLSPGEVELLNAMASQIGTALENAELYQKTREWGERLAIITELTRIINSSLDIGEVYQGFVRQLEKVMDVDWAGVNIIDRQRNELRFLALATKIGSPWEVKQAVPFEGTATEWLAQNKQTVVEADLEQERKFWTDEFNLKQGIRSIVYLPLSARGEVFGSMVVGSRRPHAYGESELSLLEQIVGAIAMPIQNAGLYQDGREKIERLEAMSRLTKIINSSLDISEVYESFAQELKKMMDFDRLSLALPEGEKLQFLAVSPTIAAELPPGSTYPLKDTATAWVIEHKRTNIERDFAEERQFPIDDLLLKDGLLSAICVPLFYKGEVFGTLNLSSRRRNAYGRREQEILEQLAAEVAMPIQNTMLYQESKEREERLAIISKLTRIITSSLDIKEVYQTFVTELERVMEVDWAGVNIINPAKNELHFLALCTKIGSPWEIKDTVPFEGTGTDWLDRNKQTLVETDLTQEKKFWTDDFHLRQGIRSIVYLPLFSKGEVFGSMVVGSRNPHAYGEKEVALLEQLTGEIAMPILSAKLYQEISKATGNI